MSVFTSYLVSPWHFHVILGKRITSPLFITFICWRLNSSFYPILFHITQWNIHKFTLHPQHTTLLHICVCVCLDALLIYIRNVTHKQNRFFSWSCNSHFKGSGTYVTIDGTTIQGEQLLTGTVIAQTSLAPPPYAQYAPTFRSVLRRLRVTGDFFGTTRFFCWSCNSHF